MAATVRAGGAGTVKYTQNVFPRGMKNKRKRKLRKIREQKEDAALAAQRKREALDEEYAAEWEDFQSRTSKR
jgi:hypothetical protein